MDRFGQVLAADGERLGEIGDGAGDFQDAVVGAKQTLSGCVQIESTCVARTIHVANMAFRDVNFATFDHKARYPRCSVEPEEQNHEDLCSNEPLSSLNPPVAKTAEIRNQASHRPKLLLVEDHRDTGAAFQRILREEGYDVVLTTSVESVIALFDVTYFDALISDMGSLTALDWT